MEEQGRAQIDDNPNLPSTSRREDQRKIVDVELIDEEFQTTKERTGRSVVVSSILKNRRQNDVHRQTGQRLFFGERKQMTADSIHNKYHWI
jgi:hypothetical protein